MKIKIKATNKKTGSNTYHAEYLYDGKNSHSKNIFSSDDHIGHLECLGDMIDEGNHIISPYIGLRDRTGREIYLNDMLQDGFGKLYKVVFKLASFGIIQRGMFKSFASLINDGYLTIGVGDYDRSYGCIQELEVKIG